jgi:hypothetical protein
MARVAESLSFSVMPEDKHRWATIEERHGGVSRSQLLRHAMDLLEAEDLAQRIAALQDAGDMASAELGIDKRGVTNVILGVLEASGYEPSATAKRIVSEVVRETKAPPRRRRSGRVLEQVPLAENP